MICPLCKINLKKTESNSKNYKKCYVCYENTENSKYILYCKNCVEIIFCNNCKICDNEHFLKKVVFWKILNPEYINNNYICNACNISKICDDNGIWHCDDCNFDICNECLP